MTDCKPRSLPIVPKLNLNFETNEEGLNVPYRKLIGSLMYLMLGSRPDICFAVSYFSQFQNTFSSQHWNYLKDVLRYLKATEDHGLRYSKSRERNTLSAFVDADFANSPIDRKSLTGFVIKIFGNVVFWRTKKQQTVSSSSAEAEYIALSSCVTECIFVAQLLKDIYSFNEENIFPVNVFEDNQSCIKMASTLETKRTKHIDVRHHFLKDLVNKKKINLNYIPSNEQIADMCTKALCKIKFEYFRNKLNVIKIDCRIEGEC